MIQINGRNTTDYIWQNGYIHNLQYAFHEVKTIIPQWLEHYKIDHHILLTLEQLLPLLRQAA